MGGMKETYGAWRLFFKDFSAHRALDLDEMDRLLSYVAEDEGVSINDVCIAGGFIRDNACIKQPKDIDVFIRYDKDVHEFPADRGLGYEWNDVLEQTTEQFEFMGSVWPVNRIILDLTGELALDSDEPWVNRVLSRFDFNICQIGYSVPTSVVSSGAYRDGVRKKHIAFNPTISLYREVNSFSVRLPRLLEKYKGWSYDPAPTPPQGTDADNSGSAEVPEGDLSSLFE